jgi:thiol-activated cytolysin
VKTTIVALAMSLVACSSGNNEKTDSAKTGSSHDSESKANVELASRGIADYVRSMRGFQPIAPESTSTRTSDLCTRVSQKNPTDELVSFNPNAGLLWPGSLLQYTSLESGTLADVPVTKRTPIEVFVDNAIAMRPKPGEPVLTPATRQTVARPSGSSVGAVRTRLLQSQLFTPPNFISTVKRSYSLESGLFKASLSANWLSSSVRSSLASTSYRERQTYTIRLTQQFYTFAVDPKERPEDWFETGFFGVKLSDLQQWSDSTKNPIVFVRSVTYGRLALLSVSSSADSESATKSVEAAVNWATGSARGGLTDDQKKVIQESEIRLWVYGGGWPEDARVSDANGAPISAKEVAGPNKADDLARYLKPATQGDLIWGLPISYRADFIGSNKAASVALATDFEVCSPPPPEQVLVTAMQATWETGKDGKDWNTQPTVTLFDLNGSRVGSIACCSADHRGDTWERSNSPQTRSMDIVPGVAVQRLNHGSLLAGSNPHGNDDWDFKVTVSITDSKGNRRDVVACDGRNTCSRTW